jgi:signal transduction histidine kinase
LSVARRVARQLGGDVILDTRYKEGSRFVLQLPKE